MFQVICFLFFIMCAVRSEYCPDISTPYPVLRIISAVYCRIRPTDQSTGNYEIQYEDVV